MLYSVVQQKNATADQRKETVALYSSSGMPSICDKNNVLLLTFTYPYDSEQNRFDVYKSEVLKMFKVRRW